MDLDTASQTHVAWKVKLRAAISKQESLDARTIGADNCCELGKWLHGEGKTRYGRLGSYGDCVAKHAAFHRAAGAVAEVINRKDFGKAQAMLESGAPYAAATAAVGSAILGLKKESAVA